MRSALLLLGSTLLLALFARIEAPFHLLGLVLFIPFFVAVDRASTPGRAALLGWGMSLGYALAAAHWFPGAIHRYTGAPGWLCWALLLLAAPLLQPQLLALAVTRRVLRGAPWRAALGAAGAYVGVEWLAPRLLGDTLAYGLHPSPSLRQWAELFGARGLTFLLLVANAALLEALMRARRGARREAARPLLGVIAGVALLAVFGAVRVQAVRAAGGTPVRLALVQANLTDYGGLAARLGTFEAVRTILDTHYELSAQAKHAQLLVWPETVYPTTFGSAQSEEGAALDAEIAAFTRARGVPLVFGAYDRDETQAEYNAAFLLEASALKRARAYRKARPFPLTEWVPELLEGPAFRAAFPWTGTWRRGPGPKVEALSVGGRVTKVSPLICYDAVSPAHVAEAARAGAQLLLTLSNDAWFRGSPGPRLHLIAAAFRSIETGVPQARATNSGISALIDATGALTATTDDDTRAVLEGALIPREGGPTLFTRLGDWAGPLGLLLLAGALAARRRQPSPTPERA